MIERDARKYRLLSEPTDRETAKRNAEAFERELSALREKHHIKDLVYCYAQAVVDPDGTERDSIRLGARGNSAQAPLLAGVLFGDFRRANIQTLDELASGTERK